MLTKGPIPDSWQPYMRIIEFLGVMAALVAFTFDLTDRQEERLARMWNLATSERPGNSGKIPALEFLNGEGKPLAGIRIPDAYLVGVKLEKANLRGARLSSADLRVANLSGADLSAVSFFGANLSGANLSGANLSGADLSRADLSGADLIGVEGLKQKQLDVACISKDKRPPKLPPGLTSPKSICFTR